MKVFALKKDGKFVRNSFPNMDDLKSAIRVYSVKQHAASARANFARQEQRNVVWACHDQWRGSRELVEVCKEQHPLDNFLSAYEIVEWELS